MARIRSIKHELFLDEELAQLSAHARLCFIGLWTLADREGRLEDRPARIRAELFPYEPKLSVESLLLDLERGGFVVRYEADGRRFLAIRTFAKHQRPNVREPASDIPSPTDVECTRVQARAGITEAADRGGSALREGNGSGEGKGMEDGGSSELAAIGDSDPPPPPLMVFPVVGGSRSWGLETTEVERLRSAFPDLDVIGEARKSLAWLEANRSRQKTARGMSQFLFGWMQRTQNDRGRSAPPGVRGVPAAAVPSLFCDFHDRKPWNRDKQASKADYSLTCPECKHAGVRAHPRPASEPASIGDLLNRGAK